jgi:hypothetical protein
MKKALPIVVVVALIAAAVIFFLKKQGSADATPGRAAELAPADTIVFVEFPDVARSKARWKETSIHKISEEPEWKALTAKWDDFAAQNAEWKQVSAVFDQIERADPAGLFVAFTSFDGPAPKLVAGFPYRGKKSDVQAVVSSLRTKILDAFPAAKAGDLTNYEGTEVETLKDKDMTISMAYRDNWFLFATDTDLLLKTLSRYIRKPGAPASLASDPVWKNTIAHSAPEPDMTVFVRWSAIAKQIEGLVELMNPGQVVPSNPSEVESILYSGKMDGLLMKDRIYVRAGKAYKFEPFANRSAAFTSPATYAYFASQIVAAGGDVAKTVELIEKSPIGADLSEALAKKGLKIVDIFAAFGQEISMLSDWESGGLSLPTFFAAIEVRDKAKARALADLMVSKLSDSKKPVESVDDGATLWGWPAELEFFQPTLAMTDKHLMFGLNTATVKAALKQAKIDGGKVVSRADFQTAQKTVVSPSMAVLYVDLKTLFERLYEKLKPMAAYALVNPEVAKYFDASKLPKAETISRHLLPIMIGWGETEGGMQMDCSGSLSFVQAYIPAIGTAVAVPFFMRRSVVAPPAPAPALPPQPVPSGNPPVGK